MWKSVFLIALIVGVTSCGNRVSADQRAQLIGRWDLERAEINGRNSDRLRSLFFEFSDNSIQSNLLGEIASYPYEIRKNQIIQTSEEPIKFNIELLEGQSLILSTSLHNSTFWIELSKNVTADH